MHKPKYPASYLFTMVTELLHEMGLSQYTVKDVCGFGYVPHKEEGPAVFVELFTRDAAGRVTGTERHVREVEYDTSYDEWASPKPQRDYLYLYAPHV